MNFREVRSGRYYGVYREEKNGSNQFFLREKCKDHADYAHSAFQSLDAFRKSGIMCDVQLVADSVLDPHDDAADESIWAHKCILAAKSDYFKAMFTKSESNQRTIRVQNVSHDILKKVLDFIYEGCCKVTQGEVKYIIATAAMLQIPTLFEECLDHVDIYNVFDIWSVADSLQVMDLLKFCTDFVSKRLGVLLEQEEFYNLPASKVHTILKLPKVNLGPKYNLQVLRDALRKWMVLNEEKGDQKLKLKSLVDCEKLGISFQTNSEKSPSYTRLEATSRITEFPACFSLIAVIGGVDCGRCFPKEPTRANVVACRGANIIEIFDTQSLTWVNFFLVMYPWPIHCSTFFLSDGMFYFLAKGAPGYLLSYQSDTTPKVTLHRFEPVLSRLIKVRDAQDGQGLARLASSRGCVKAMTENREEIFCCGSVRVRSAESGKVAFKINWKKNTAEDLPNLPSPRYHHGAVVVDGDLFIIGGCTITREPLASVVILRTGHNEWEEGISMSSARIGPGIAVLGDYIYAVGGTGVEKCLETVERYHIGRHLWEPVSFMNCPRVFAGVVAAGGSLFVFGGQTYAGTRENPGTTDVLKTCEKYDPHTDSWTALPDMSGARCQMVTMTV